MSKQRFWRRGLLAGTAIISLGVLGIAAGPWSVAPATAVPSQSTTAIGGVLHMAPFRLEEAYRFAWNHEAPLVSAGYLVVLDVNPTDFVPRQGLEPVLQFGPQTIERVNQGHHHGRLVGIVPASAGVDGWPTESLAAWTPFLAEPALPEQVRQSEARAAWTKAQSESSLPSLPLPAAASGLELQGYGDLLRVAADLIRQHSPTEKELADTLSMPVLRRLR